MKMYVLFAEKKDSLEGKDKLDALACLSESGYSKNSEYLLGKKRMADASGEFKATVIAAIRVSDGNVLRLLYPNEVPVNAAVIKNQKRALAVAGKKTKPIDLSIIPEGDFFLSDLKARKPIHLDQYGDSLFEKKKDVLKASGYKYKSEDKVWYPQAPIPKECE